MEALQLRLLRVEDLEAYRRLRQEMLADTPLAFMASPEDDWAQDPAWLRTLLQSAPEKGIWGAFAPELQAVVGFSPGNHTQVRTQSANLGCVRHACGPWPRLWQSLAGQARGARAWA